MAKLKTFYNINFSFIIFATLLYSTSALQGQNSDSKFINEKNNPTAFEDDKSPNQNNQDSIHFLILKVSNTDGIESVELMKSMVRSGRLKKDIDVSLHHESEAEPYILSLMSRNKELLKSTKFPNPLVEYVEYVEYVDDDGLLKKKEVKFEEKEFLIRIPYNKSNSSIKFEKSPAVIEGNQKRSEDNELIGIIKIN